MYTSIFTYGDKIYTSYYTKNGKRIRKAFKYNPYLYVKTRKPAGMKSFPNGDNVKKITFDSIYEMRNSDEMYPPEHMYGKIKNVEIVEKIRDDKLDEDYDPGRIRRFFFDIETFSPSGFPDMNNPNDTIISISACYPDTNQYFLWYLSESFEFSKLDCFRAEYPAFKKVNSMTKAKSLIPKWKKMYKKRLENLITDVKEKIKRKKKEYDEDENIQKEFQHVDYYIEDEKNRKEQVEKRFHYMNRVDVYFKRINNMKIIRKEKEVDLIRSFMETAKEYDVISGWNSTFFDLPYLMNREKLLTGKNSFLSPFGKNKKSYESMPSGEKIIYKKPIGIQHFDYLELDKNYRQNKRGSYRLENVSQDENGYGKVDYTGKLSDLWMEDKQRFLRYNIRDSECLQGLDEKLGYINLLYSVAHYAGSSPDSYRNATYIWEAKLFNEFQDRKFVIPSSKKGENQGKSIRGAYVKETKQGIFDWIVSVDLKSLYPSLMMMYNMSHEMIVEKRDVDINKTIEDILHDKHDFSDVKNNNCCMTPNGLVFSKEKKGIIIEIIEILFNRRSEHKKKMKECYQNSEASENPTDSLRWKKKGVIYENIQKSEKVLLNSIYGAFQVSSFALYNRDIAEGITTAGQIANRYCDMRMNSFLRKVLKDKKKKDRVVAGDTDSFYIDVTDFFLKAKDKLKTKEEIVQYLDNVSKKLIVPTTEKIYKKLNDYVGSFKETLIMEREVIAEGAFWKAMKRYAMWVHDDEGNRFKEPKMKIMGMKYVRSDTPEKLKPYMKKFLGMVCRDLEMGNVVRGMEKEIKKMDPVDIAKPSGVNVLDNYYEPEKKGTEKYRKGCPYIVKGAIRYNELLRVFDLENKYERIRNKDGVKFLYLKPDNEYMITGIAFHDDMPEEFNLKKCVDIEKQYDIVIGKFFSDYLEIVGKKDELRETYKLGLF